MNVGVCTISSKERSVEAVFDVAAAADADGVEVWGKDHVGEGDPETCGAIADAAAERDLAVAVYGSYLRAGTEEFAGGMDRELRIAEDLSADLLRVWAGDREADECDEAYVERVAADLSALGDAAADRGLGVSVERHAGTVTNTTDGAAALIEATPSGVGLNWQPYFEHDAAAVAADARELAPLANNVHLQAVPERGGGERCALADAYFDVEAVTGAFDDAGFGGFLEVEFVTPGAPYPAAVAADVAFLRALTGT